MLQVKRVSQITLLHAPELDAIPGIVHAFSTRRAEHSEFTLGPAGSDNPAVQLNRARFLAAAGMAGWPMLRLRQMHTDIVHDMRDTWAANEPPEGDASVTALHGATLEVQTADCVPILIAHRTGRVVAAVHVGWRGTAARVAVNAVACLVANYDVDPADLTAVLGPHNAVCCYEVGEDVVEAVRDPASFARKPEWPRPHFNQALANQRQLVDAGIPESQIVVSNLCTQCRPDLLYSYRRDGKRAGRLISVIGIAP